MGADFRVGATLAGRIFDMLRLTWILIFASLSLADDEVKKAPEVDVGAVLRKSEPFAKKCAALRIRFAKGVVRAEGEVAYRGGGPCEYLINIYPAKSHETVVLLDAGIVPEKQDARNSLEGYAKTLNNALMAAGFKRGKPFAWNDETGEVFPPSGDAVHIYVEWKDPTSGEAKRALMSDWLWNFRTTHTMQPDFVYAGSTWIEHDGKKYFAADLDGLLVAVLNNASALVDNREDGSLDNGVYEAIPLRMPPLATRVVVVFSKTKLDGCEKYEPLKLPPELVKARAEYLAQKAKEKKEGKSAADARKSLEKRREAEERAKAKEKKAK